MDNRQLIILAEKYITNTASEAEKQELHHWYDAWEDDEERVFITEDQSGESIRIRILARLEESLNAENAAAPIADFRFRKAVWFRYAAIILLLFGAGTYLYITSKPSKEIVKNGLLKKSDIPPGSNKAILTLADGQQVRLDSSANEVLAEKGIGNNHALISYSGATTAGAINTLSTPRGGQYKIKLSDGTMVWLNAASSITYPTVFTGSRRTVKIAGEAYLEVAKDRSKPFDVQVGEMNVEVLGTSFNINAYSDEKIIKTTLIEGSVRVNASKRSQTLIPGQQAQVSEQEIIKIVRDADISNVMAWKNGAFNFNDIPFEEVMRQLARWYDIDVVYEGKIPDKIFFGEMGRNLTLLQCLKLLEKMHLHFRIEGRKLIVM